MNIEIELTDAQQNLLIQSLLLMKEECTEALKFVQEEAKQEYKDRLTEANTLISNIAVISANKSVGLNHKSQGKATKAANQVLQNINNGKTAIQTLEQAGRVMYHEFVSNGWRDDSFPSWIDLHPSIRRTWLDRAYDKLSREQDM